MGYERTPWMRNRTPVTSLFVILVSVLVVTSTGATVLFAGTTQAQPDVAQNDVAPVSLEGGEDVSSASLRTTTNPALAGGGKPTRASLGNGPQAASANVIPSDFSSETYLSDLNQPMGVAFLPDGRALVIQKPGKIEITDPNDGTKDTETYMDISDQVYDGGEHGLIDITIDPNFEDNGYLYLFYTNGRDDKSHVARFEHTENGGGLASSADPGSEFEVWKEHKKSDTCCHQGAGLDFGPDGKLWFTPGDDFKGGDQAQDLSRTGGKIIRINKDGSIPDDNPYANDGDSDTLPEIWSYGLRNPYRAEWDLQSERFFIGNVGGNDPPDYEEVEVATLDDPKTNYGWPRCEATSRSAKVNGKEVPCDIDQTPPLYAYDHSVGNSITGGEVYHGDQFPSEYEGAYFFGDYAKDFIKYLTFDGNGDVANVAKFETGATSVNSITVGPEGSLYWTSVSQGDLHKVSYVGNNAPSIDSVSADPTSASSVPQTVNFDVSASDPDGDQLSYEWTFGDGSTGTGPTPSHTYEKAGTYTAYVEVSDGSHTIESEPIEITIGEPPTVTIDSPDDGTLFRADDDIGFSASASDPQDGDLSGDSVTWNVNFTHNPEKGEAHTHPILSNYSGADGSFHIDRTGHDYRSDTGYTLTATATDSDGLSTSKSVSIDPDKVDVTFGTNPDGLEYAIDGIPQTGTVVYDSLINFKHEVNASATQCLDGKKYEFQGWSDGGAKTHNYTVPESDSTLTANYEAVGECSAPDSGLVAHYEADQGVATNGGEVTGWADQSGQGNDLTAAGDPTVATTPSGQPAISFDGDGDLLQRTDSLNGLPAGDSDRTMIAVVKYDGADAYGGVAYGDSDKNEAFGTVVNGNDGKLTIQGYGSAYDLVSDTQGIGAGWLTQSAVVSADQTTHYKNGTEIDSAARTYDTTLTDGSSKFVISEELGGLGYADMEVAEVLVYDRALSDSERKRVENQLQDKYIGDGTANQPPTANDDSATVDAGGSTTIDVLANDNDPEGNLDPASVTVDSGPSNGTATANDDGTITYTHDGSEATSDSFAYTVADDAGANDSATVSVAIDKGSDDSSSLPVKNGLVTHFAADEGVSTSGGQVAGWADQSGKGNDLTASGDPVLESNVLNGSPVVSFDGDGDLLQRTDSLNGLPAGDGDRTVMSVVDYRSSPDFGGGVAYGAVGCSKTFGTIVHNENLMVQGYCQDFDSGTSADVGPSNWLTQSAVLSSDQVTHYKNGSQIDQFTHTFKTDPQKLVVGAEIDGDPQVDMGVAEVVVYDRALSKSERQQVHQYFEEKYFGSTTENRPPTASNDSATVAAGQSATIDVLANDSDSDGTLDTSSVEITSQPSSGSATVNADGTITYDAPADADGKVTFTYTVDDDDGATSNRATVTVSVSNGGPGPVGDFENPPTDPDGDGLYEDVNGDGKFTIVDAQALYQNLDDEGVTNNLEAFDFNGNGELSIVDAQALYNEQTGGS